MDSTCTEEIHPNESSDIGGMAVENQHLYSRNRGRKCHNNLGSSDRISRASHTGRELVYRIDIHASGLGAALPRTEDDIHRYRHGIGDFGGCIDLHGPRNAYRVGVGCGLPDQREHGYGNIHEVKNTVGWTGVLVRRSRWNPRLGSVRDDRRVPSSSNNRASNCKAVHASSRNWLVGIVQKTEQGLIGRTASDIDRNT